MYLLHVIICMDTLYIKTITMISHLYTYLYVTSYYFRRSLPSILKIKSASTGFKGSFSQRE